MSSNDGGTERIIGDGGPQAVTGPAVLQDAGEELR